MIRSRTTPGSAIRRHGDARWSLLASLLILLLLGAALETVAVHHHDGVGYDQHCLACLVAANSLGTTPPTLDAPAVPTEGAWSPVCPFLAAHPSCPSFGVHSPRAPPVA